MLLAFRRCKGEAKALASKLRRLMSSAASTSAGSQAQAAATVQNDLPATLLKDTPEETERKYLVKNYWPDGVRGAEGICFVRGEGSHLITDKNERYLDFMSGIAVNALGHSDPAWVEAVRYQAGEIAHVSNLFHTAPPLRLAKRLVEM